MDDAPGEKDPLHPLDLFLASTTHDMKNSVSVLSGTLETLIGASTANGHGREEPAYAQMAHMLYETRRLNDNLIALLALYKQVGRPEYPFDVQPLEVGHLIEQVVASERILLTSKGIALEADFDPALVAHFDEDLIIGVLGHAINNAIHYTRDTIRIAVLRVDDGIEIRVEDNGDGYPQAMLDAGAAAMSGARRGVNFLTSSTGLGLYFASEVAKMHKHRERSGSLRLENGGKYGGGCFILNLP
jgi:signal transduction histidine kinase